MRIQCCCYLISCSAFLYYDSNNKSSKKFAKIQGGRFNSVRRGYEFKRRYVFWNIQVIIFFSNLPNLDWFSANVIQWTIALQFEMWGPCPALGLYLHLFCNWQNLSASHACLLKSSGGLSLMLTCYYTVVINQNSKLGRN